MKNVQKSLEEKLRESLDKVCKETLEEIKNDYFIFLEGQNESIHTPSLYTSDYGLIYTDKNTLIQLDSEGRLVRYKDNNLENRYEYDDNKRTVTCMSKSVFSYDSILNNQPDNIIKLISPWGYVEGTLYDNLIDKGEIKIPISFKTRED